MIWLDKKSIVWLFICGSHPHQKCRRVKKAINSLMTNHFSCHLSETKGDVTLENILKAEKLKKSLKILGYLEGT